MPKESKDNDSPKTARRKRKRIWLAAIIVALTAIIASFLWSLQNSKSVEQRLAAIEAARAIPDSENAAVIYHKLAMAGDRVVGRPGYSDARDTFKFIRPRRSGDYPKVAAWLQDRQDVISELLKASEFEKCRFTHFGLPLPGKATVAPAYHFEYMDKWIDMLICTMSNDIEEGRKVAAIEKFLCLMQIANHLYQDTFMHTYAEGLGTEMMALLTIASLIVEGDAAESYLETLGATLTQTKDNWTEDSAIIAEVYKLMVKQAGKCDWLRHLWRDLTGEVSLDRVRAAYMLGLAARRGTHILIALRRHKNRTGYWPESLDEIRALLTKEILTDPQNHGLFVYKPTKDSFTLYSRGRNKIDEAGKFSFIPGGGADDWPIWPPPFPKTKPREQNPDTHPTIPNADRTE